VFNRSDTHFLSHPTRLQRLPTRDFDSVILDSHKQPTDLAPSELRFATEPFPVINHDRMAGDSKLSSFHPSVQYGFVRGRQLEGTFPGDKQTGVWPITGHRISYGWGHPPEESWPYPLPDAVWPSIEPPGIDAVAKESRYFPYKRVRTIVDCKRILLSGEPGVMVSLDISEKWANPPEGRIPVPSPTDLTFSTHFISLQGYDPQRDEFTFHTSWGNWGRNGYGDIAAETLAATWWEGWKYISEFKVDPTLKGAFPRPPRESAFEDTDGSILHWLEILDEDDNRVGWASALETRANLEIEELFVRPEYRRSGHGGRLFQRLQEISLSRCLPLRIWISFPDAVPQNLKVIEKIARPIGLSIQASGKRWAPLVVAPIWQRRATPLKTFSYPESPPAGPAELLRIANEILQNPLFRDVAAGTAGVVGAVALGVVGNFLYDALKSWLKPESGKKIRAKLGDLKLETSEISPSEFIVLARSLLQAKSEAEVQSKILEAGITLTVINNFETKIYKPQRAPEQQPRVEPKPTPVLNAPPQSPAETAHQVAAPRAPRTLPKSRKRKR
jgi:GNAT superfamily N-acetyltransferase